MRVGAATVAAKSLVRAAATRINQLRCETRLTLGRGVESIETKIVIVFPFCRVIVYILPNAVQRIIIAHDMFEIIALPDDMLIGVVARPFGDTGFETANDG